MTVIVVSSDIIHICNCNYAKIMLFDIAISNYKLALILIIKNMNMTVVAFNEQLIHPYFNYYCDNMSIF